MRIDAEELSQPVSEDQPCGEDLEYDGAFQAMETAMQAREDQEMGDEKLEGSGPDWPTVAEQAKELLGRTKDFRVYVPLATAVLNTDGLIPFHQSLLALNDAISRHWDDMHPLLDADDDFDPMMRMNILQNLDDYATVRMGVRRSPLVELKGVGGFSLHDIELATGAADPADGEEVTDKAIIEGAFLDCDRERLAAVSDAVSGALDELGRLGEIWSEKTDGYEQPGLDNTVEALREVQRVLVEYAPAGTVEGAEEEGEAVSGGETAGVSSPGTISNTADVIQALDRICEYYRKNEPSSPIPVLLKRAQRLVSKDFYDILLDLAPDGVTQFDQIRGESSDG